MKISNDDKKHIKTTYIRVTEKQKQILEQLKLSSREPYHEILDRLIKFIMMKREEFVKELDLPKWVLVKLEELAKNMEEEKNK